MWLTTFAIGFRGVPVHSSIGWYILMAAQALSMNREPRLTPMGWMVQTGIICEVRSACSCTPFTFRLSEDLILGIPLNSDT